jgi:hypothetical protein
MQYLVFLEMPYLCIPGPIAQRLEQGTHNPLVAGSIPAGPTWKGLSRRRRPLSFYPILLMIGLKSASD